VRRAIAIDDLKLSEELTARLKELGIHLVDELVFTPPAELSKELGLELREARGLVKLAAEALGLNLSWLDEVKLQQPELITTGSKALDELTGGVEVGSLTEFYGSFATGKTQLCHQLCVNVQLPRSQGGVEGEALYIDCDGTFRPERLREMAEAAGLSPEDALRRVYVVEPKDVDEQVASAKMAQRLPSKVKLVVVDTVTSLFRAEYQDVVERQWRLLQHIKDLEAVAHKGTAVVLANQVVARLGEEGEAPVGGPILEAGVVRVRLVKLREDLRLAKLENSPRRPEGEALFRICREGIRDA